MWKNAPFNVADYRELARQRLPKMVFDYLEGGAEDEQGLQHNREVFQNVRFKPRRLVDVSQRELSTRLFGKRQALPLLIGPTGLNGALWPKGDLILARAASRAGIPFVLSTASNLSIEDLARQCDGELWFQLYVVHRTLAERWSSEHWRAGYTTLVLTTDVAVNGYRERDLRNQIQDAHELYPAGDARRLSAPTLVIRSYCAMACPNWPILSAAKTSSLEVQAALMSRQMDASFDWQALRWLRDNGLTPFGQGPAGCRRCAAMHR